MILVIDADASKVIEAVRSTGVVITRPMIEYAHYLISNMKNIGTWQLSNAVYGFVGGTSDSHKWNWKDLRDVDAAFRLTFNGGVTHNANGIQGDGSTGFADTKLIPSSILINNNTHLSLYCNLTNAINATDIGCAEVNGGALDNRINLTIHFSNLSLTDQYSFTGGGRAATSARGVGYYLGNRQSNINLKLIKDGITIASNTSNLTLLSLPTEPIYLLAEKRTAGLRNPSSRRFSFSTIGSGLTDTQAIQQSQIITNAQNILNRA